jgi:hypothetical protein
MMSYRLELKWQPADYRGDASAPPWCNCPETALWYKVKTACASLE